MELIPDGSNPRGGRPSPWKISNDYISGMGYPIHFYELDFIGVFTGIGTNFHKSALEPCILLLFTPTY